MDTLDSDGIGLIVAELLEATEIIHAALIEGGALSLAESAYDKREGAFERLKLSIKHGDKLNTATRVTLARIHELDAEILSAGGAEAVAIRDERNALNRRRSAIQAHGTRERAEPRVITVKA